MLSNAYFLAKFRFDTAENEPAKNWQEFCNLLAAGKLATLALGLQCTESFGPVATGAQRNCGFTAQLLAAQQIVITT